MRWIMWRRVAGAEERSEREFFKLLPAGLETPGHYLFEILEAAAGQTVGYLWFAEEEEHGLRSAFVYDLVVAPEWRRQGHARRAFREMEEQVRALGIETIGLHVFGHNPGAQALYAGLGYGVTSLNLAKRLC